MRVYVCVYFTTLPFERKQTVSGVCSLFQAHKRYFDRCCRVQVHGYPPDTKPAIDFITSHFERWLLLCLCVYVCMCVCVCARVRVCVCVCV